MSRPFLGAHVALFLGDRLLVVLRDDKPDIPSPDCWDFPGGTAEAGETPIQTLQREVREEVALHLPETALIWKKYYRSVSQPAYFNWFFVARMPETAIADVALGDEGQRWTMMTPDAFLAVDKVVPSFPPRLRDWMAGTASD